MRKVILLEHLSLDGYLSAPDGDMSWIHVDDELWDYVGPIISRCDTAIYGRTTYEMQFSEDKIVQDYLRFFKRCAGSPA